MKIVIVGAALSLAILSVPLSAEDIDDPAGQFEAGRTAFEAENYQEAIEHLTPLAKDNDREAMLVLSRALWRRAVEIDAAPGSARIKELRNAALRWMLNAHRHGAEIPPFLGAMAGIYIANLDRYVVDADSAGLRSTPGGEPIHPLGAGQLVAVMDRKDGWIEVATWGHEDQSFGWVRPQELSQESLILMGEPLRLATKAEIDGQLRQASGEPVTTDHHGSYRIYKAPEQNAPADWVHVQSIPTLNGRIADVMFTYDNGGTPEVVDQIVRNFTPKYGSPQRRAQGEDGSSRAVWEENGISIILVGSTGRGKTFLSFRNQKVYIDLLRWRHRQSARERARQVEEQRRKADELWEKDFGQ